MENNHKADMTSLISIIAIFLLFNSSKGLINFQNTQPDVVSFNRELIKIIAQKNKHHGFAKENLISHLQLDPARIGQYGLTATLMDRILSSTIRCNTTESIRKLAMECQAEREFVYDAKYHREEWASLCKNSIKNS